MYFPDPICWAIAVADSNRPGARRQISHLKHIVTVGNIAFLIVDQPGNNTCIQAAELERTPLAARFTVLTNERLSSACSPAFLQSPCQRVGAFGMDRDHFLKKGKAYLCLASMAAA